VRDLEDRYTGLKPGVLRTTSVAVLHRQPQRASVSEVRWALDDLRLTGPELPLHQTCGERIPFRRPENQRAASRVLRITNTDHALIQMRHLDAILAAAATAALEPLRSGQVNTHQPNPSDARRAVKTSH